MVAAFFRWMAMVRCLEKKAAAHFKKFKFIYYLNYTLRVTHFFHKSWPRGSNIFKIEKGKNVYLFTYNISNIKNHFLSNIPEPYEQTP